MLGQAARPAALSRPLADRIAWHERKASLLSRIAADLDTPEAHEVAAEAWDQLAALAAELRGKVDGGGPDEACRRSPGSRSSRSPTPTRSPSRYCGPRCCIPRCWMIATAQLFRLLWRLIRFIVRHPLADLIAALLVMAWRLAGWPGPVIAVAARSPCGRRRGGWRWPASWSRLVVRRRRGAGGAAGSTSGSGPRS